MSGYLPGLMLATLYSIYIVTRCWSPQFREPRVSWKGRFSAVRKGILVLVIPVLIGVGVYGGVFTPTEAGGVVLVYTVIASVTSGKLKKKDWLPTSKACIRTVGMIYLIVFGAAMLAVLTTLMKIPRWELALYGLLSYL